MKTAIILAQGQGLKAWPLSVTRPKASLPIGGTALLRLQLDHLGLPGSARRSWWQARVARPGCGTWRRAEAASLWEPGE